MLLFVESVSKTSKRNGVVQTKVTYLIFQLTSLQLRQPLMGPCIEQSMEEEGIGIFGFAVLAIF